LIRVVSDERAPIDQLAALAAAVTITFTVSGYAVSNVMLVEDREPRAAHFAQNLKEKPRFGEEPVREPEKPWRSNRSEF
jgi:hypothetical protein